MAAWGVDWARPGCDPQRRQAAANSAPAKRDLPLIVPPLRNIPGWLNPLYSFGQIINPAGARRIYCGRSILLAEERNQG
jgi:hypothetical protein